MIVVNELAKGTPATIGMVMDYWLMPRRAGTVNSGPILPDAIRVTGWLHLPNKATLGEISGIHLPAATENTLRAAAWFTLQARGDGDTQVEIEASCENWEIVRPVWEGLRAELVRLGFLATANAGPGVKERDERGMNFGTPERVKAFHDLVKHHKTHNEARKKSHCDPRTYYDHCKEVTGEDPIFPLLPE